MKSFGIFFWLLVLCLSVPPSSLAAQSGKDYIVWVTNPLDPVSKTRKPLGISQYQLHSARGESEGYHLVITAAADDLKVEKISISDLKSSDQIISDDFVRIYKEHYLGIFKRGPFAHLKKGSIRVR